MIKHYYITSPIPESYCVSCQYRSQFCNIIPTINPIQQRAAIMELLNVAVTSSVAHCLCISEGHVLLVLLVNTGI